MKRGGILFNLLYIKSGRCRLAAAGKGVRSDVSRVMCRHDGGVCHLSTPRGCPRDEAAYPPAMDGPSLTAGIFGLATHGMCGLCCRQQSRWALTPPFHPYLTWRRLFSVTYPRRHRRLPVRKHVALSCPDFPLGAPGAKRQTSPLISISNLQLVISNYDYNWQFAISNEQL